jgi:hypothetical protein
MKSNNQQCFHICGEMKIVGNGEILKKVGVILSSKVGLFVQLY